IICRSSVMWIRLSSPNTKSRRTRSASSMPRSARWCALPTTPISRRTLRASSSHVAAFSLLALTNLLWAGNWVLGRALRDSLDPVSLNFWRWFIALAVLTPFGLRAVAPARARAARRRRLDPRGDAAVGPLLRAAQAPAAGARRGGAAVRHFARRRNDARALLPRALDARATTGAYA